MYQQQDEACNEFLMYSGNETLSICYKAFQNQHYRHTIIYNDKFELIHSLRIL